MSIQGAVERLALDAEPLEPQPMVQVCLQTAGGFSKTSGSTLWIKWQEARSNPTLFDMDDDGGLDLDLTNTYGRRSGLYRSRTLQREGQLRFRDATERTKALTSEQAAELALGSSG